MGVTIHYRGSLQDMSRIEDFEDRVLDLVLDLRGHARLWRSASKTNPERFVRGLMVNLAPGQEGMSLLISPEGYLIGLWEIEACERGELTEPSWCFVKTRFGPVEGHVALVELLTALKQEFMPDLEVHDEGEYWETRNLAQLRQKITFLNRAIGAMADALSQSELTPEAAEDPEIVAVRVERIARQVHRTLQQPAEHPPVEFPDNELGLPPDPQENERLWDEFFKQDRRRQERMHRSVEERLLAGAEHEDAFDAALREEVTPDLPGDVPAEWEEVDWQTGVAEDAAEPWQTESEESDIEDAADCFGERLRHPLQEQAAQLSLRLFDVLKAIDESRLGGHLDVAVQGSLDIGGGLAQALSWFEGNEDLDADLAGLHIVQLKRALRGAAFAHGALIGARYDRLITEEQFQSLFPLVESLQEGILSELKELRDRGHSAD